MEEKENYAAFQSQSQLPTEKEENRESLHLSLEKKSHRNETTPEKVKIKEELPSVSPLIKRYNYH